MPPGGRGHMLPPQSFGRGPAASRAAGLRTLGREHALAQERALVRAQHLDLPQRPDRAPALRDRAGDQRVDRGRRRAASRPRHPAVAAHWTGMSSGRSVTVAGSSPPPGRVALPRSVIRRATRAVSSPVWSSRVARSRTSPAVTVTFTSASSAEVRGSPGRTASRALATDAAGRPFASGVPTVSACDSATGGLQEPNASGGPCCAVRCVAGAVGGDQRDPQRRGAAPGADRPARLDPDRARDGLDRALALHLQPVAARARLGEVEARSRRWSRAPTSSGAPSFSTNSV